MIALENRRSLAHNIDKAHGAGARLRLACGIAGIDERTLQRWKAQAGLVQGDGRPQAVRPVPSQTLSPQERAQVLCVANEPRFAAVPPARIVPMLADEGVYLASESSFARAVSPATVGRVTADDVPVYADGRYAPPVGHVSWTTGYVPPPVGFTVNGFDAVVRLPA